MSSLSNIKNHLRAVENIKQITTSMEMVASARFKRAQERARQAQFYIAKMQEILEKISASATDLSHPLFIEREVKKIGLVIVSSDRGLCGSYNTNIFAEAERFLADKENVELYLMGRKAIHYFQRKNWKIQMEFPGWSGKITLQQIKELSDQLVKSFLSNEVDCIWLLYTKFYTLMHREITLEKFLPIGKPKQEKSMQLNYIFEPTVEEIYDEILPSYCMTKIETMLNQSYASELVARIFSMKAAAKNAEEMLADLTLERNKVRQTGITREMLETTASARE